MLRKLRLKFVLINMSIVAAMLLVIFATVYAFTKSDLDRQCLQMLQSLSQDRFEPGQDAALPYFTVQSNVFGDLHVMGHTYYDLTDQEFLQTLIQQVYDAKAAEGLLPDYQLRYRVTVNRTGQLFAFVDISGQRAALGSLVESSVAIGMVSLVVFLVVSILLARWAVKPVEKAWQQQRQFVSDASHELKTPLTVIMSNAELLHDPQWDTEHRSQFAYSILTMSRQMRDLVEGLLELARADNGQIRKAMTHLDLSKLIQEALLPFEPVLFERNLVLESQVEPGIFTTGNERYLGQVVEILLDNAAKYSAPGVVQLQLRRQGRAQCLLRVSNPGLPIPEEERERIFERFYRTDQARSRDGSFGLGLSIAKSIVQEHGGKIWVESNDSGNCFCVQLPCA